MADETNFVMHVLFHCVHLNNSNGVTQGQRPLLSPLSL